MDSSASRDAEAGHISLLPQGFQALSALKPLFVAVAAMVFALGVILALMLLAIPLTARAADLTFDTPSKSPVPRWAMLRKNEVYARNGPSKDNQKVWTYRVASLPVQIISETRDWRLICDPDGGVAWVSRTMLQAPKTVMALGPGKLELRASPNEKSQVRAYLRPKSLASLNTCKKDWCRVSVGTDSGWAPQNTLWGTQETAVCQRPDPFTKH